ncbi:eCIS core domain-containing protein [Amycolatopsis sulphurea]|uniref:eCIS core domain-containing protein n=1 Tax=Amycolatopsis sulphurea TaxID=76022 RepID=UPI000BF82949|nr:DUF4157 domain-containing protein [Amycolatopsis sulphurea]
MHQDAWQLRLADEVVRRSTGVPLDWDIRAELERRLGTDLAEVRIHTGAAAHDSAVALNAVAYTVGQDIVFRDGGYIPSSVAGKRLLVHELTHVLQQRNGSAATGRPADLERQAEINATAFADGNSLPLRGERSSWHAHGCTSGAPSIVQCYREVKGTGGKIWCISDSAKYVFLKDSGEEVTGILWVRKGSRNPRYFTTVKVQRPGDFPKELKGDYRSCQRQQLFLADCLNSAEEVMYKKPLLPHIDDKSSPIKHKGHIASKITWGTYETLRYIGASNKENKKFAEEYRDARKKKPGKTDYTEAPRPGQAFLIVRLALPKGGESPYHAAAVIAMDGRDRLTLETSAGTVDAKLGEGTEGILDIYEVDKSGEMPPENEKCTFRGRYKKDYGKKSITVTIEPIKPEERERLPENIRKPPVTEDTIKRETKKLRSELIVSSEV